MSTENRIQELRTRIQLALGSATLLITVVESETDIAEARRLLLEILRATPLNVVDLGECGLDMGPGRWAELTRGQPADVHVLTAPSRSPLAAPAFAGLLNAERELLRQLAGPVVLLLSRGTERVLRQRAPDFMTWAAQSYELPGPEELSTIARRLGVSSESVHPAAPEEEPIRFLHISDLHLRPQRVKRYDQNRVLLGLIDLLEREREKLALDLVFVTGDLAHGGKADEIALVVERLRRLIEVTGVPRERLFVVPGNHDVDRDVGRWLLRTLDRDEDAIKFFEEEGSRQFHAEKFAAYRKGLAELFGAGRSLGLGVGADAVEFVEVRGARVAVASFNSAWFAQADDDNGKLWLGEPSVAGAAGRIADEGASFAIALLHHPFDYLHEIERDGVEQRFERTFDLVLRGHLHRDKTRSIASQRGGFVEVAGPAAYQGSQWPNGCFFGEIRPQARTVTLRPYAYVSGADPWVLDTRVFPDDAEEGYCHTFTVPEKRRISSALAKKLARAAEEAVMAAPAATQRAMAADLGIETPGGELSRGTLGQAARAQGAVHLLEWSAEHQLMHALIDEAMRLRQVKPSLPISRKEHGFLENALSIAALLFCEALRQGVLSGMNARALHGRNAAFLLDAALQAVIEGPVVLEPRLPDGSRPDILIGHDTDPAEQRAVIEVKVSLLGSPAGALKQLDRYLKVTGAAHGAAVLVGSTPQGKVEQPKTEPKPEHATTPEGRDVLLLRL